MTAVGEAVQAPLYQEILYTEAEVDARIEEMAAEMIERYRGVNPLFVCLLRGGAPFSAKLMAAITRQDPYFQPELDYMTVKTYGSERTPKPPQILSDLNPNTIVKGRTVVVLDDALDSGETGVFADNIFTERGAERTDLVVLVSKERERVAGFAGTAMVGLEAPDRWLVGMGLDDAQLGVEGSRWAGYIAIANDAP